MHLFVNKHIFFILASKQQTPASGKERRRIRHKVIQIFSVEIDLHTSHLALLVHYIKLSFFNKNSNIEKRESKIEKPTKSPNEPPIDPNIPTPS